MSRYNGEPGEQGSATGQGEGHFHTNLSADRVIGEDVQRFAKALLWWLSFNPKRLANSSVWIVSSVTRVRRYLDSSCTPPGVCIM